MLPLNWERRKMWRASRCLPYYFLVLCCTFVVVDDTVVVTRSVAVTAVGKFPDVGNIRSWLLVSQNHPSELPVRLSWQTIYPTFVSQIVQSILDIPVSQLAAQMLHQTETNHEQRDAHVPDNVCPRFSALRVLECSSGVEKWQMSDPTIRDVFTRFHRICTAWTFTERSHVWACINLTSVSVWFAIQ